MKRIFLLAATLFSVVFLSSCVEQSGKYKELQAQLDSLQGSYGTQKNQLDEIFAALNEIESGLTSIRESEQILSSTERICSLSLIDVRPLSISLSAAKISSN